VILALLPWTFLINMRQTLNRRERVGVAAAMSMGVVYGPFRVTLASWLQQRPANMFHSAGVASFIKMAKLPQLNGQACALNPYIERCHGIVC
jgi:hypothetical protein